MLFNLSSRATVETTLNGSVLFIYNVSISDAGVFTCLANNGIPRERPITIREKLFLLVNRKFYFPYMLGFLGKVLQFWLLKSSLLSKV